MKYGLWSFSKFVPTDVVRQVLNAGNNEAQLGVKMREVTLLEFIGDAILAIWNAPQVSHIAERARAADLRNERTSALERSRFCFALERGCGGWIRFGRDTTPNLAVARRDPVSPVA
jgi:class 3 adenylate cyclase